MSELEEILDLIQFKTKKTLEEISSEIGYSRPYLNTIKKHGGNNKILTLLKSQYSEILHGVSKSNIAVPKPTPTHGNQSPKTENLEAILAEKDKLIAQLQETIVTLHEIIKTSKPAPTVVPRGQKAH